LCFYGLGLSKSESAIDRAALWPQYVRDRLHKTYGYLAASLGITASAAMFAARSPFILRFAQGGIMMYLASLAAVVGSGILVQSIDYDRSKVAKHMAWLVHSGILGAVLAPICLVSGSPVLLRAAIYTLALCGGLTATALTAPSEKFLMMSGPLAMGLAVVFAANIGSFFFHPSTALGASLASIVVYGGKNLLLDLLIAFSGLILFSAFLLYDTQRIIRKAEMHPQGGIQTLYNQWGQPVQTIQTRSFDPLNACLSLYMDVLNIFIRFTVLSGSGNRK
jgi:FtsH-binding integral membrane protein